MNLPHVTMIMLAIGLPDRFLNGSQTALQIVFGLGLVYQTMITQVVYERWLFSPNSNVISSNPTFLLNTFGWFDLALLGLALTLKGLGVCPSLNFAWEPEACSICWLPFQS
jgi:hypothetical protein